MSELLCVTNRGLCKEDFLLRIEKIASVHPSGVILREKDLDADRYEELAEKVLAICQKHHTLCILHSFTDVAAKLKCDCLHLPLPMLLRLSTAERAAFQVLGASCHSVEDALEAERLGCTYITAGHIFDTDCKKGLPGRGVGFLREVCERVSIPVYGIGGIRAERMEEIRKSGAAGACVMSGAMLCENVQRYFATFEEKSDELS